MLSADKAFGLIALGKKVITKNQLAEAERRYFALHEQGEPISLQLLLQEDQAITLENLERVIRIRARHGRVCGDCGELTFLMPGERSATVACESCGGRLSGGRVDRGKSSKEERSARQDLTNRYRVLLGQCEEQDDPALCIETAQAAIGLKRYAEAKLLVDKALEMDPHHHQARKLEKEIAPQLSASPAPAARSADEPHALPPRRRPTKAEGWSDSSSVGSTPTGSRTGARAPRRRPTSSRSGNRSSPAGSRPASEYEIPDFDAAAPETYEERDDASGAPVFQGVQDFDATVPEAYQENDTAKETPVFQGVQDFDATVPEAYQENDTVDETPVFQGVQDFDATVPEAYEENDTVDEAPVFQGVQDFDATVPEAYEEQSYDDYESFDSAPGDDYKSYAVPGSSAPKPRGPEPSQPRRPSPKPPRPALGARPTGRPPRPTGRPPRRPAKSHQERPAQRPGKPPGKPPAPDLGGSMGFGGIISSLEDDK